MRRSALSLLVILALWTPGRAHADPSLGYYRQPALHGDTIVFVAEGDLWRVASTGGTAARITTHPGMETHPAISPDGEVLAFVGEYEGVNEIYTMPLSGGLPLRRTYSADRRCSVEGFTAEGKLIYATRRYATLPNQQLVVLDLETGERARVPLSQAAEGAFDATTLFFTLVPFQGSHAKRYQGGTAQSVWRFDPGKEAVCLTEDFPGTNRSPMVWEGRVYFVSDRDGTLNLWSMNRQGAGLRQHTRHSAWDLKTPSLFQGRVVYQLGAGLRLYDIPTNEDREISIRLTSDFDQTREKWIQKPIDYLSSARLSPKGDRVVLTARGEVFVAPTGQGRRVEVTRRPEVRYRNARFLTDGEHLVVLSDESGEVELWTVSARGFGERRQLTEDGSTLRWEAIPSPDGRWIAHHDKNWELWLYDVENRSQVHIDTSPAGRVRDLRWSPDGRWLAYVVQLSNWHGQIRIFQVAERTVTNLTTDRYDSFSPAWSPDGRWIYFLSDRHFRSVVRSPWGPRQPEPFFQRPTKIYQLALRAGLRSPFAPEDELHPETSEPEEKQGRTPEDSDDNRATRFVSDSVKIELDGIAERLLEVPVRPGDFRELWVTEKHVLWSALEDLESRREDLRRIEITNKDFEEKTLVRDVHGIDLSLDRKKILVRRGDSLYVLNADAGIPGNGDLAKNRIPLDSWSFSLVPREEWRQMFVEAWRLHRDYFYDRNMHGVDWRGMLEKYLPLVNRVSDRAELSDLIAQMVSELSALHASVRGGDRRTGPDQVDAAALGALLSPGSGGVRIEHIYRSDPDEPERRSPLVRFGLRVTEGDVIEAINGLPVRSIEELGLLLRNQVGQQVLLTLRREVGADTYQEVVTPISSREEEDLRYHEWEYTRRLKAERLSAGRIGYVHLRAMGPRDISQWARDYYPVFAREGLIIDVRHNRGGNIDSWILEKLLRKAWFYWQGRSGEPYWNMQYAFRGHMVVLCNEFTASDGEAFAEGFRRLGLGKVIGTRTWGGEIWLTGSNTLVDRGVATAAEFGVYGPEGEWLIEGHGVDPDIVVRNLPHETFLGRDRQLEVAIDHLLEQIQTDPVEVPGPPPYPDKSFDDNTARKEAIGRRVRF